MGYLIHLRTNGYSIDHKLLDILTEYKPRKISITLYGASDETYFKICGIPDGYTTVTQNILLLKKAGFNLHLTMTVTKDNVNDIEDIDRWATENGMSVTPFGALITPIRGAKRSVSHLKIEYPKEEFELPDELIHHVHYEVSDRDSLENPFWMCRGFGAQFCISWDGRMTVCNTFTNVWKNVLSDGVESAYHDLYRDLRALKRPQDCYACKYIEFCSACPSQLQSATGDAELTCDNVCKYARRKFRYYLQMQINRNENTHNTIDNRCEFGED